MGACAEGQTRRWPWGGVSGRSLGRRRCPRRSPRTSLAARNMAAASRTGVSAARRLNGGPGPDPGIPGFRCANREGVRGVIFYRVSTTGTRCSSDAPIIPHLLQWRGSILLSEYWCAGPSSDHIRSHLNTELRAICMQSGFDITGQSTILSAPSATSSAPSTPLAAKLSAAQLKEAAERKARTSQCVVVIPLHVARTTIRSLAYAHCTLDFLAGGHQTRSSR